jgi:hypothetical protein
MVTPTPVNQNISTIPTLSTGQLEDEMDIAAKFISSPNPDRSLLDRGRMKTQPPMSDEAKKTREDIEKKLLENASRLLENAETMAVQNTQDTQFTVTTPIEIKIENADGSEKIQRIEAELNLIKQNQSASTAGAPVIV